MERRRRLIRGWNINVFKIYSAGRAEMDISLCRAFEFGGTVLELASLSSEMNLYSSLSLLAPWTLVSSSSPFASEEIDGFQLSRGILNSSQVYETM